MRILQGCQLTIGNLKTFSLCFLCFNQNNYWNINFHLFVLWYFNNKLGVTSTYFLDLEQFWKVLKVTNGVITISYINCHGLYNAEKKSFLKSGISFDCTYNLRFFPSYSFTYWILQRKSNFELKLVWLENVVQLTIVEQ